jgi:hypothetical protein
MTVKKLTDSINKSVITGLVFIFTFISTGVINAKPLTFSAGEKGIVGVWQLNRTKAPKKSKQTNTPLLPVPVLFAPESLVLAADEGDREITINEGFKEFIHTQTFLTDGTVITKKVQSIGDVSAKAYWKNKKLVVEVTTSRGDKMTEIFELSSNQKQLNVTLQINDGGSSAKTLTVRRVYHRMTEQVEDNTAEVGITGYPF